MNQTEMSISMLKNTKIYGELSKQNIEDLQAGARIDVNEIKNFH